MFIGYLDIMHIYTYIYVFLIDLYEFFIYSQSLFECIYCKYLLILCGLSFFVFFSSYSLNGIFNEPKFLILMFNLTVFMISACFGPIQEIFVYRKVMEKFYSITFRI